MNNDKKKTTTQKKSVKPVAKKSTAKKPATNKTAATKSGATKKAVKTTAKNPTVKATQKQTKKPTAKAKYPKHSDKEELKVGAERPIIINGRVKASKPKETAQSSKAAVTGRAGRVSSITYHIKYD